MGAKIRCWNHQVLSSDHPHLEIAAREIARDAVAPAYKKLSITLRVQYTGWFAKVRMGICPFCNEQLLDEAGYRERYEQWRVTHVDPRHCGFCNIDYPNTIEHEFGGHHIANGINVCPECLCALVNPST